MTLQIAAELELKDSGVLGQAVLAPGSLNAALGRRGLSPDDLAALAGVHSNTIARLNMGLPARHRTLAKVMRALDECATRGGTKELVAAAT